MLLKYTVSVNKFFLTKFASLGLIVIASFSLSLVSRLSDTYRSEKLTVLKALFLRNLCK